MPSEKDVRLEFLPHGTSAVRRCMEFPCAEYKSFPTMEGAKGFMELGMEGENQLPFEDEKEKNRLQNHFLK